MYAGFFGFRELPFNNTPDPRFFYPTPDHEEALASLVYAVKERKGFVLLTGEVGTGKTLVSRMMLRHFGMQIAFAMINHSVPSVGDLMESICTEFELPVKTDTSPTQLVRILHDFLLAQFAQNIPVVLVLDEAQNLPAEGFEQLRMIGNLEADDAKLLQMAIVGQPELQRMFLSPELRQIRQRIFRSFHLPALSREATGGYIRHRLSVVTDTNVEIFKPDAVTAIYKFSRGLPRVINTICDNALLSAYSADKRAIDAAFLDSVVSQMMIVGGPAESAEETAKPVVPRMPQLGRVRPPRHATADASVTGHGAEHGGARSSGDVLAQRIEQMGRQVAEMEIRLRALPSERQTADRCEATGSRADVMTMVQGELARFDSDLRLRVAGVADRLAALERGLKDGTGDLVEARTVEASLKPLVQQARAVVSRAESAARDLDRRDTQLRALGATVKDIIRDLRKLLDRAQDTSARSSRAEQSARAACDRLVAQSQCSRRLADELTLIADRLVSCETATRPRAVPVGQDCSTGDPAPTKDPKAIERHIRPDAVRRMLDNARDSLSELRDVARRGGEALCDHGQEQDEPATTRLVRQVEGLLDMIEPEADPATREIASATT
jgi:general secretion pathway protein A